MTNPDGPLWRLTSMPYPASKTALNMVTAMYAKELRDEGILVNAANPGYCATDLNGHRGFRTAAQGAEVSVHLATLPDDGPTGQLWGSLWVDGAPETRTASCPGDRVLARIRHHDCVTRWEYARLEYRATGSFGADQHVDWNATFHHPSGPQHWGVDERFDDLRHLNRAGYRRLAGLRPPRPADRPAAAAERRHVLHATRDRLTTVSSSLITAVPPP